MTGIIRVALYARVSSQQQADAHTIDSQTSAIRERIRRDGFTIDDDRIFCDEGYSGSELLRPSLEKLRDLIAASLIDRLYVHTPDRLARKYSHQALLLEEMGRSKCEIIFGDHEGLAQNPETNLLVQMQGVIAEYEREKILERTRRGRRHAAANGNVSVFGGAPYGYRYLKKTTPSGKANWQIDEVQSQHVQLMFQLVGEQGYSLAAVCRELESRGVKTAKGNQCWHTATVHDMLVNPAYHGQARYGKQRLVPRKRRKRAKRGDPAIPRRAKVAEATPLSDQVIIAVPAIVSLSLFERVNEVMQENRKRQRERQAGAKHLLSGLLICGACGSAYCGHRHRGKREYFYYRCIGADKYRRGKKVICENTSVNGDRLDAYVWSDVCKLLRDPSRLRQELERRQNATENGEDDIAELSRRVERVRGRLDRMIDAYEQGLIESAEFQSRIVPLRSEHDREVAALASLRGRLDATDDIGSAERVLTSLSEEVDARLTDAPEELKRDILKLLIRRIEIHPEEIRLVYKVPQNPFDRSPASQGFLQHYLACAATPSE
jgi:site-specific DNA recombinase